MNEACVQYIVSSVFSKEEKIVEAYGIRAKTYSTKKYPLICNILSQLLFLSDEEKLVESTIYSNEDFIVDIVEELGEACYANIRNNMDEMLFASEEVINSKIEIKQLGYIEGLSNEIKKIEEKEDLINRIYMDCQMSIFTMYFNRLYKRIENPLDIKYYRSRINSFKSLLGFNTDKSKDYLINYYKEYYKSKSDELKAKESELKRKNNLALVSVSDNIVVQMFSRIKNSIFRLLNKEY